MEYERHELWTYNYVARFESGALKIGVTSNPTRRANEYLQEATRHRLGKVSFCKGQWNLLGICRITEQSIRDHLRTYAVQGHREWFVGDEQAFVDLIDMTRRIQCDVRKLLGAFRPPISRPVKYPCKVTT